MITFEHKEVLRDIRAKLNVAHFDDKLDDDSLTTMEGILQDIEKEYESNTTNTH